MVLTGQPGIGKTTIINSILKIVQALGVRILLATPTGRAAKRTSEATGYEAKAIHRLLEYSPKKAAFQKNDERPLDCDLLVADEFSMVNCILMHYPLKAVPVNATLLWSTMSTNCHRLVLGMFSMTPSPPEWFLAQRVDWCRQFEHRSADGTESGWPGNDKRRKDFSGQRQGHANQEQL
jgi:hypothetical protein